MLLNPDLSLQLRGGCPPPRVRPRCRPWLPDRTSSGTTTAGENSLQLSSQRVPIILSVSVAGASTGYAISRTLQGSYAIRDIQLTGNSAAAGTPASVDWRLRTTLDITAAAASFNNGQQLLNDLSLTETIHTFGPTLIPDLRLIVDRNPHALIAEFINPFGAAAVYTAVVVITPAVGLDVGPTPAPGPGPGPPPPPPPVPPGPSNCDPPPTDGRQLRDLWTGQCGGDWPNGNAEVWVYAGAACQGGCPSGSVYAWHTFYASWGLVTAQLTCVPQRQVCYPP